MGCSKYPHMFAPMTIKGVTFKNRVVASPITTNRIVDPVMGYPTAEGIDVYETKARGGFGVVTLTESFIDHEYSWRHEHGLNTWENPMTTYHMEAIMTLTEAIKAHGAVASIQLNHVGALNHPDAIPGQKNPIGPSAFVREDGVQVEEMTVEMMEKTAAQWAEAAWNCKTLGFQMVNLHGGHGWLLNQFISPRFNHRTDEFGGSMENRARFPIMVCKKIKEVCGDDFLIVPVVAVGGFNSPAQIEEAIASGKCDFVALGRQQFADPEFVNKTLEGREDEIAPCLRCSCFNPLASNPDERPIPELWHCAVDPWGQRELRWRNAPKPKASRKVLVVGGAKVQILEMRDAMCKDSGLSQRMALLPRMEKADMILDCSVSTKEIKPNGVVFTDKDGNEQFAEADRVLYCCGNRSNDDVVKSLEGVVPRFVVTGDAKRARIVKWAAYEGFCAAMDIL